MSDELYDVIIIGGGPAGLSAAQYASRSNLKTVVLDKSPTAGALAYTSKIENYPGLVEPVSGSELLDLFRNQAIKFGAEYVEMQVVGVAIDQEIKEVQGIDKTYKGKTVIIATGSMGRKPSIPGEGEFLGKGVSYCAVCDAAFYKDLQVCVIGDSEEAVKEAGLLTGFAKTVYLIAPSKELDIQSYETELNTDKVKIITGHRVVSIDGDDFVKKIKIKNIETEEEQQIPMDGVFVYLYGTQPVVDFLSSSLSLSDKSCIITHRTMETSIPGVFAAGDVSCSEVRQVVIAAAFGSMAALSAEKFIRHRKRAKYDWLKS
ncbi:MAG: FAD-dependent oxidoreductase [Nitrospiraceae bacterium]|nr:MAG: FAD-dependent oxidoreductase [Nitrospiraceae bacterium]